MRDAITRAGRHHQRGERERRRDGERTGRRGHMVIALAVALVGVLATSAPPALGAGFDPADSLDTARFDHTATALADGRVLVAGGYNSSGPTASAEIYDPATNSWSAADSLDTARYDHTATALADGRVLVAGGVGSSGLSASAEIY